MMQARCVVLVTILTLNLGSAETHGNAANADVVALSCVSNHASFTVVANLGGYLTGSADARRRPAVSATNHLHVGALFRSALLRLHAWILVLGAIAPDGSLLFPK
jgi:hypothetical protein